VPADVASTTADTDIRVAASIGETGLHGFVAIGRVFFDPGAPLCSGAASILGRGW
jgi:hypothetical protein